MRNIRNKNRNRQQIQRKESSDSSISQESQENFWDSFNSDVIEDRILSSLFLIHVKNLEKQDLMSIQSIKLILNRLQDNDAQVVINILNGIQNLSENKEFFANLQKLNLFEILQNLLNNKNELFQNQDQINNQIKVQTAIFDLSSNFCEKSNELQNWQTVFDTGINYLQQSQDFDLIEKILDFTNVLTESNETYCQKIIQQTVFFNKLIELVQNRQIPSQINSYIGFIIYNIYKNINNIQLTQQIIDIIYCQIQNQLQIRIIDEIFNLKLIVDKNDEQQQQQAFKLWLQQSKSIQIIFGLLITIFENDDEQFEDQASSDDMIENCQQQTTVILQIQSQLQNKLMNEQIISSTLNNLKYVSLHDLSFLKDHDSIFYENCQQINELCLSFLSNLQNFNFKSLDMQILEMIWVQIEQQTDYNVLLSNLKLFYQLMQNIELCNIDCQKLFNQMNNIINMFSKEEEIQLVVIDIISYRYQPKFKITMDENLQACDFFIKFLQNKNIMIASQALNGIFDIYQNEDYDVNFKNKDLINTLQQGFQYFQENLKTMKGQKNYGFLKDCLNNLKRFIQYKKDNGM